VLAYCALLGTTAKATADDLYRAATDLKAKYAADLEKLALWCDERGLKEEAKKTRLALGPPRDPYKLYLPVLGHDMLASHLPGGTPASAVEWDTRLGRSRHEQAMALYDVARRAIRTHRASLAYELVLEAIRVNPDFETARRVLGYQKYRNGWYTSYEVRKLRAGQVWHERFGWLPKGYVHRYEEEQRFSDNRWVTAAEDAKAHAHIESGWDVESEHYTIRTDHSLEAGVVLGVKLEQLYHLWQQIFIRYYASEATVIGLFDGRARTQPDPPLLGVVYFRNQDDYNRTLRTVLPNVGITTGVFLERTHRAYFFAGKDADDRTLYHEATHQLFHQSRPVAPGVGQQANFWIVEGIAMYMETLHREDAYYVLGGADDVRLHAACYRVLNDNFYIPLAEVVGYGMEQIQGDKRIGMLYSEFAGLTHFLVYYDNGRYRDALVAYLSAVYSGQADTHTLAQLTGTSYDALDKQYRKFVEEVAAKASRQ
jgi:hypothetical protein